MSGGRRPAIEASVVATGKGDDGTTGLLFGGPRIAKDDPRTEAYGTIDEAVAALGVARAATPRMRPSWAPSSCASSASCSWSAPSWPRPRMPGRDSKTAAPASASRCSKGSKRSSPISKGASRCRPSSWSPARQPASAALELARTILRRAERRATTLDREHLVPGPWLIPYLNRLADLAWVMARFAESVEAVDATPAVVGGRRAARASG